MKRNILVSACLIGDNTKYNGLNNYNETVIKLAEHFNFIKICPEVFGGLSTPRIPAEVSGNKVLNKEGHDVTENYNFGAQLALNLAIKYDCKYAILKEKSPSCGVNKIYDGTFTSTLIDDMGITTRLLKLNNILVYSENEIEQFLKDVDL